MGRLVLGLDIGITSVGYGVIDIDNNIFVDYGVRLFKEGTAENNAKRREFRSNRRLKRRKHTRLEDMKKLLKNIGIYHDSYIPFDNPYLLRLKGLTAKLTDDELVCAIMHITKNRGTTLDVVEEGDDESGAMKEVLQENKRLLKEGKYICEIQLDRLQEVGKIRGSFNNFRSEDYVAELKQILSNQEIDQENITKILELVKRKRAYYDGPGSEKSPTPYGRWIDYGVEPIDLIEKMRGKCSIFKDELRAPKLSYTAELFNLLNDLNNLTINNEKITKDQKMIVIDFVNKNGGITIKQFEKLIGEKVEHMSGFRQDKNKKPLLTEFKGYKMLKKCFDSHKNNFYVEDKLMLDQIAEILTKKKGIQERFDSIKDVYPELEDALIYDLSHMKSMTQYHSLSFKAMRLLNEEMMETSMNQMQLIQQMHIDDQTSFKGKKYIEADDEAILSPVAKRAQREAIKVINSLRAIYGEFDSIVIETTRAKNSKEKKKQIEEGQKYFENENKKVNEFLKEARYVPENVNSKTKLKIRLYLQQDGKSAYTQKPIDLKELITDQTAYEVDHIIPLSISLDDSINNKVLVTRLENQYKEKLTPLAAFSKGKFESLGGDLIAYKLYVRNAKNISKKKKEYLLYEKDITKFSNMKEFIARNLVDTSYANRVVLNTLQKYFKDNEIDTKVHTIKGSATHMFRKRVNFDKVREQDYLHHAIDALIVASIKKLNILDTYLLKYNINELYDERTGELIAVEDDDKVLDAKYIQFISGLKTIHQQSFQYYNGLITKDDLYYPVIKISHKINTKPNRSVSDQTIYSTRLVDGVEKVVKKYKDIYDPKLTAICDDIIAGNYAKYLMYQHDKKTFDQIVSIIMNHFETYKDDSKIYTVTKKKNQDIYKLKGENPLYLHKEEHGMIRKYSKKNNGPFIQEMKYLDGAYGNGIDISHKYTPHNKKVVLQQISPYRTDFYVSKDHKYKMVTVRYSNVFYKDSIKKYVIDKDWYETQKQIKGIDDSYTFVCSLHRDELIGIKKKFGEKYIFNTESTLNCVERLHQGEFEILKFTATNNDAKNIIEVKPIYTYCSEQLKSSIGPFIEIAKFSTDVLGNLYKIENNILKLEFE